MIDAGLVRQVAAACNTDLRDSRAIERHRRTEEVSVDFPDTRVPTNGWSTIPVHDRAIAPVAHTGLDVLARLRSYKLLAPRPALRRRSGRIQSRCTRLLS